MARVLFPEGALPRADAFALAATFTARLNIGIVALRRQTSEAGDCLCRDIDARG